jgi:hypothetical protein
MYQIGGRGGTRTLDLLNVNEALLAKLSYAPKTSFEILVQN